MDSNPLSKFIGKELKDSVSSVSVQQQVSKDGNSYYVIAIKFINGYTNKIFVFKDEVLFAFANAFDLLSAQNQIDNNFNN